LERAYNLLHFDLVPLSVILSGQHNDGLVDWIAFVVECNATAYALIGGIVQNEYFPAL
jgi:hypothetical protein